MKKVLLISAGPIVVTAIPASEKINSLDHGSNFLPSRNANGEEIQNEQGKVAGSMLLTQEVMEQTITDTGSFIAHRTLSAFQGVNKEDCPPIGTIYKGVMQTQLSNKPFYMDKNGKWQQPVINPSTGEEMHDENNLPYYRQVRFIGDTEAPTTLFIEKPVIRLPQSEPNPKIKKEKSEIKLS